MSRLWGPKVMRPGAIHPDSAREESPPETPNRPPVAVHDAAWPAPQAAAGAPPAIAVEPGPGDGEA
jgi:hypothetical protein